MNNPHGLPSVPKASPLTATVPCVACRVQVPIDPSAQALACPSCGRTQALPAQALQRLREHLVRVAALRQEALAMLARTGVEGRAATHRKAWIAMFGLAFAFSGGGTAFHCLADRPRWVPAVIYQESVSVVLGSVGALVMVALVVASMVYSAPYFRLRYAEARETIQHRMCGSCGGVVPLVWDHDLRCPLCEHSLEDIPRSPLNELLSRHLDPSNHKSD